MKKNRKKKILIAAVALGFVAIMALGSMAYFTSRDEVTNTFMVASFDPDNPDEPDDLFSIEVFETDPDTGEEIDEYTYKNIAPADVLHKDPTVRNTGAYSQYVRVQVTLSNASAWLAADEKYGIDLPLWTVLDVWESAGDYVYDEEADTLVWTYYLSYALDPGETQVLFTTVTIPSQLRTEDMEEALANFQITVTADAIQSANTGVSAQEAFQLFDEQEND